MNEGIINGTYCNCQICQGGLKKCNSEATLEEKNARDKLIDIILKVAMQHHDDISKSDEDAACDATDEILREFPHIECIIKDEKR